MKKEYYLIIAFMIIFTGCTRIAKIYNHQGHLKFLLGDYQSAINKYTNALKLDDKNTDAYFSRGLSNFYLKNYSKAVDDFSNASRINPKDAFTYYYRGNAKFNLLDYRGAIEDYSIAIKIDPTIEEFYYSRIDAKDKLNDIKGKIDDYSEIINLNPMNEKAYSLRGFLKLSLDDFAGAIFDLTKFIEISPRNVWSLTKEIKPNYQLISKYIEENPQNYIAHIFRGMEYGEKKDFTKAIEIDSLNPVAYYLRGRIRRMSADTKGAIDDFTKVIQLAPDKADAYVYRAEQKKYLRWHIEYEKANDNKKEYNFFFGKKIEIPRPIIDPKVYTNLDEYEDYKKAFEIDTENKSALKGIIDSENYRRLSDKDKENLTKFKNQLDSECNRALSESRLNNHVGVIYDCKNDSAFKPTILTIGEKRILLQYHNKTVKDINRKIEANPNDNSNYSSRGDLRTFLQDYTGAIEDYTKALQLDSRDTMTYYNRAAVKLIQLDYNGAIDDISVIVQIYPKDKTAYYSRACVKFILKDYKGAIDDITKVIQIDPESAEAYYKRSLLEIKIGQKDNGCKGLSKAGELGYAKAYDAIKEYCQ